VSQPPAAPQGVVVACPCGEVYELKPEYAGRLLECPVCARHLRAGPTPGAAPRPLAADVDPAFDRDVFLLNQRVFRIASEYEIWSAEGRPILFVHRPTYLLRTTLAYLLAAVATLVVAGGVLALAAVVPPGANLLLAVLVYPLGALAFLVVSMSLRPLRHVSVYRDDSRRDALLRVRQDQRLALLTRTYTVLTPAGVALARLRKTYLHNIVRKRWYVETPGGRPFAMAIEDSMILSLLRRVLGPFFGLLRTNFVLVYPTEEAFGEFNRKLTLLDRYVLDLSLDRERGFDRRVALALGVMLDTGERR